MQATARWGYEAGWLSGLRFDTIFVVGVLALSLMSGLLCYQAVMKLNQTT